MDFSFANIRNTKFVLLPNLIFFFVDMLEDMHDYGVYKDVVDITFDEEELEDSCTCR